jgi:Leucine-rich repeat (LRR) protein
MTTTTATLAALRSGQLKGITRLDLSCDLQEFPREIFELADTLEVLNLSGNALAALPDDLSRLSRLRVLFCSENRFTQLPEVLASCVRLEMVGFKANYIREVAAVSRQL